MIDLLMQGGVVMIFIGICSVVALAFTIERAWFLWHEFIPPQQFWNDVEGPLMNGEYERALERARGYSGVLSTVVQAGLNSQPRTREHARDEMEEVGMEYIPKLERFLPALNFIAQVSPLLGLLGTVAGMIQTFAVIAEAGVGQPDLLAGGISQALVTTAAGLTVGILTLFFHHLLSRRVEHIVDEMELGVRRVESYLEEGA